MGNVSRFVKTIGFFWFFAAGMIAVSWACGGSAVVDNGDAGGGGGNDAAAEDASAADAGGDAGQAADGGSETCTPDQGNDKGIGKKCTAGGGECAADLACDIDLDPQGVGMCIKLNCTGDTECGSGATCCKPSQSPINICIIDSCKPADCSFTPDADAGTDAEMPDAPVTDASVPDAGADAGTPDASVHDAGADAGTPDASVHDAGVDAGSPADGGADTCIPGAGNDIGVGKKCTKGGKECASGLSCDLDLDPSGVGGCIKLMCTADSACGTGAKCCQPSQSPIKVCIIDMCLPPECP